MCLDVEVEEQLDGCPNPLVADKDIVCYKVLKLVPNDDRPYAPYQSEFSYELGKVHEGELDRCGSVVTYTYTHHKSDQPIRVYEIEVGFHSFDDCLSAIRLKSHIKAFRLLKNSYAVFECRIPAGALYYEGEFCGEKAYASDKIIIDHPMNCSN